MSKGYRLTISCPDRPGIVSAVSGFVANYKGNVVEASHYSDPNINWFFMRHVIEQDTLSLSLEEFYGQFALLAEEFNMKWRIQDSALPRRVLLMVSKLDHCLTDLLYRWKSGEMDFDIPF